MSRVFPGRYTAEIDEPFVVFLIGMRVNRIFAVRKWLPTTQAMTNMLGVLFTDPEKGFMGGQTILYWRGIGLIQYWRSFDDLERFARSPSQPHLGAWRRFNQTIGADGTVGFWHETYMVEPGKHEAVYGNMPMFGLAAAARHVPAVGRRETARRRLGGENEPAVPSPITPGVEPQASAVQADVASQRVEANKGTFHRARVAQHQPIPLQPPNTPYFPSM